MSTNLLFSLELPGKHLGCCFLFRHIKKCIQKTCLVVLLNVLLNKTFTYDNCFICIFVHLGVSIQLFIARMLFKTQNMLVHVCALYYHHILNSSIYVATLVSSSAFLLPADEHWKHRQLIRIHAVLNGRQHICSAHL